MNTLNKSNESLITLQSTSDTLYFPFNAEIIWEQIDVLNQDVLNLFGRNMKDLKKSLKRDAVRLLDYDGDEDEDGSDVENDDSDENQMVVKDDMDDSDQE